MTIKAETLHQMRLELSSRTVGLLLLLLVGLFWMPLLSSGADAQGALSILTDLASDKTETSAHAEAVKPATGEAVTGAKEPPRTMEFYVARALKARDVVLQILQSAPDLHETIGATLRAKGGHGDMGWLWATLPGVALALGLGFLCYRLVLMWGRKHFARRYSEGVQQRADKLSYLFLRGLLMLAGLVVYVAVAGLIL
ncbi:MAG: hypothetical protein ABJO05_12595, partial [Roseibium sp.]